MTRAKETSLVEDLKIHDMRCQPDKHSGCHPTCPVLQAKENDMTRAKGIHLQEWKQALERLQVAERRFKEARRKARAHLWAYLNANFVRGSGQVAKAVHAEVADAWYKHGIRKFWPRSFDCGEPDKVQAALRHMADNGVLMEYAVVSCDGQVEWQGPRADINPSLLRVLWAGYADRFGAGPDRTLTFEDAEDHGCIETTYEYVIPLDLNKPPEK